MQRTLRQLILFVLCLLFFAPVMVAAAGPTKGDQVPGYYRIWLGEMEVTALHDGSIELDTGLLQHTFAADLNYLLDRAFVGNPKMSTAVNAYLVNSGKQLVLIDSGAGQLFGPSLGRLAANLQAAGYEPGNIDLVVLTHLHGDHIGGLVDGQGKAVFPAAKLLVAKAESDFWLSEQAAAGATEKQKPFFAMAKAAVAPYQARGSYGTFEAGAELAPGLVAVAAAGHTPGHSAFRLSSGQEELLVWGDIIHAHAVQFARPGVSIEFDIDGKQAIATRRQVLKASAASKSLVAGMHLPFPGIGRVRDDGHGVYSWVPVEFATKVTIKQ